MQLFPFGHATHPQWQMAAGLVLAQLRAQMTLPGYAPSPPWACSTSPTTTPPRPRTSWTTSARNCRK